VQSFEVLLHGNTIAIHVRDGIIKTCINRYVVRNIRAQTNYDSKY